MVHFFLIIGKQILQTFCILDRNICSLKNLLYFKMLVMWEMCIVRAANKRGIIAGLFFLAIFYQNPVLGKTLAFLFMTVSVKYIYIFLKPVVWFGSGRAETGKHLTYKVKNISEIFRMKKRSWTYSVGLLFFKQV